MRHVPVRILLVAAALALAGCTSSTGGQGASSAPESVRLVYPSAGHRSTPHRSTPHPSPASTKATPRSTPAHAPRPAAGPATVAPARSFRIADATFVGNEEWVLGTAACSGTKRCTALYRSTDAGRTWHNIAPPPVNVSVLTDRSSTCTSPCVTAIRFASAAVGYVFGRESASTDGSSALLMTTDAGRTWHRQPGGADALESLSGNVVRVVDGGGCPPGCTYSVQVAAVGSANWRTVRLPAGGQGVGAQLTRTGHHVYLLTTGNPAGGAQRATSVLFVSRDDGAHWTRRGEVCPQTRSTEIDSVEMSTATDGAVGVLCRPRLGPSSEFVAVSRTGARTFTVANRRALGSTPVTAFATASARVVLVSLADTFRSTDSGNHFRRVAANAGSSPGDASFIGFGSGTLGHAVSGDRRALFTTTDAGATWTAHQFG